MTKLSLLALSVIAIAAVPGIASATHFNVIEMHGDCQGWTAQVEINWRSDVYTGTLDYTILLLDGNTVLEQHTWSGVVSRNPGDPQDMHYTFQGPWSAAHSGFQFTVQGDFHIVAPWTGGIDDQTATDSTVFQCSVAAENATWSTIKSLYR